MNAALRQKWFDSVAKGRRFALPELVELGMDVNEQSKEGIRALTHACERCDIPLCKVLVGLGADVNLPSEQYGHPLAAAVRTGSVALCQYLLDQGAHPDARNECGSPALHLAIARDGGLAKMLLRAGANINALDNDSEGRTPLIQSVLCCRLDVVQSLIALGADVNAYDDDHTTALMHACSVSNTTASLRIIRALVNGYANPNLQTPSGWTALMDAVHSPPSNNAVIKLLLAIHADPTLEVSMADGQRVRALTLAVNKGNKGAVEILSNAERAWLARQTIDAPQASRPSSRL